jgi:hypothetical protein
VADAATTAGGLGYSVSFFNSDPELKALLDRASAGDYTPARFTAELQNTNWFRTKGEAARKMIALQQTDPATYNQQITQQATHIAVLSQSMGALASPADVSLLATHAMQFGWNDEQIKQQLNAFVKPGGGAYSGQAGQLQWQYKQLAAQYGATVSDGTMQSWVQGGLNGAITPDSVKQNLVNQAASKYPGFKDRLMAGETMQQIADPYIQSQAKILELNPQAVQINDPLIQQALSTKDSKGQPSSKTVWQFEQDLRNDPRWTKTQNAQDSMMQTGHGILQQFGLVS